MNLNQENRNINFFLIVSQVVGLIALGVILLVGLIEILGKKYPEFSIRKVSDNQSGKQVSQQMAPAPTVNKAWYPPNLDSLPASLVGDQIRYGRELVTHTAKYFGPAGSVGQISNGMNCQNCHLEAGTKLFGNNYALVAATYPKFRARSGTTEDVVKRVNDCFERSLNGKPLKPDSKEMLALVAYIKWVGKDVPKDEKVFGSGLVELPLLYRAASPGKGQAIYVQKCQTCHGPNGEGIRQPGSGEYLFPPLWGPKSYNNGAGLYRISKFARYIKANMPLGATYDRPQLADEEAWDLAAYVNSRPRPKKDLRQDWPRIEAKPFDHPFGPFADFYSEEQHKFGPFKPIVEAKYKVP